ncbi:helix-hairpin-helix domain-containing protein [Planctomicrobium sp.]|jgi:competence protein ComEA|nr:helix-hairpin-helix domain-containing protein [Planctomicrobium sp.]MDB4731771.1 helix-hairpin-helix domain-containing protein [bacterium]
MDDGEQFDATEVSKRNTPSESALGLTRSDQIFLVVIVVVCVGLFGAKHSRHFFSTTETIEVHRLADQTALFQIEINSATWVEWMQLDGVGELTARKIVDDRELHGPFEGIAEVTRVKGIGPATIAKMEPYLRCDDCL